jgi:hypothetical protein
MPAPEIRLHFCSAADRGPGFNLPVSTFNDAGEVQQLIASDRILNEMTIWP